MYFTFTDSTFSHAFSVMLLFLNTLFLATIREKKLRYDLPTAGRTIPVDR